MSRVGRWIGILAVPVLAGALSATGCDEKTGEFYLPAGMGGGVTPNGAIEGRVVDEAGNGLSDVTLTRSDGTTATATTDEQGNYAFPDVVPGTHTVTITPPGNRTCTPGSRTVSVTSGGTAQADFTCVRPPGSITGTVTESGSPVSGATVNLEGNGITRSTTTGGDGTFTFMDLPPGPYTLTTTATDRTCGDQTATVTSGEATSVAITCQPPPGSVSGTVTTNGQPESGVVVRILQNGSQVGTDTTDDQGAYSITGIPAGAIEIVFESTPAAPIQCGSTTRTGTLAAGGSLTENLMCTLGAAEFSAADLPDGQLPQNQDFPVSILVSGQQVGQFLFNIGAFNFSDPSGLFIDAPGSLLLSIVAFQTFLRYYATLEFFLQATGIGPACVLAAQTLDSGGNVMDEQTYQAIQNSRIELSVAAAIIAYRLTFRELQSNGCSGSFLQLQGGRFQPVMMSSARFKTDVVRIVPGDRSILGLRPVVYRYRAPWGDPATPRAGLIAEEVSETYPTAVARDAEGRPEGIYYPGLAHQVWRQAELRVRRGVESLVASGAEWLDRAVTGPIRGSP